MKYSETPGKKKTQWRLSETAVALLTVLIVSACSSSDSPVTGAEGNNQFPPPSDNQLPLAPNDPVIDPIITGPGMQGGDTQFPSAPVDSGPESLIVTGIDSSNPDATSAWLVNSRLFRLNSRIDTTGDATVELVRYSDDFPVSRHVDFYSKDLDTCEVDDPDAITTSGGGGGDDGGGPPPTISGGETVVINTPSGPWFTLNRFVEDGQPLYTIDNGLPGELLPAGATLSIPGDEFPTVAAHPLYDPIPPVRLLPDANNPVAVDSAYSWIPSSSKTYMNILLLAYNADNSFVDFAVSCDVRDDGSFSMPAEVINFILTTPYRLQARYDRVYSRVDFVNGIVIRQSSEVSE